MGHGDHPGQPDPQKSQERAWSSHPTLPQGRASSVQDEGSHGPAVGTIRDWGVRDKGSGRAWGEHRGPLPATWGAPVLIIISYSYGSFLGNCFILHGI